MSIATQITRLQNIKTSIKNALIRKGISAESHNMEDFANDIDNIASGTDVSNTTATASDVLNTKYFYTKDGVYTQGGIASKSDSGNVTLTPTTSEVSKSYSAGYYPNAHGAKVSAVSSLTPSTSGATITSGTLYKASANGKAVSSLSNITPTADGTALSSGGNYHMNASGYAYSEHMPQSFFGKVTMPSTTSGTWNINLGFKPKYLCLFLYASSNSAVSQAVNFEDNTLFQVNKSSSTSTTVGNWIANTAYTATDTGYSRSAQSANAGKSITIVAIGY